MSSPVRAHNRFRLPALAAALALSLTACGGGGDEADAAGSDLPDAVESAAEAIAEGTSDEDAAASLEEMAQEMADDLEAQQQEQGGGSATLTAGDQTWSFDRVLCAFGEEETGQEGTEFVLSSIQDGLQFYVSIDDFGHTISLDDIEDFENPSVSLYSDGSAGDFITLDGRSASGEAAMVVDDGSDTVEASFEATCP